MMTFADLIVVVVCSGMIVLFIQHVCRMADKQDMERTEREPCPVTCKCKK